MIEYTEYDLEDQTITIALSTGGKLEVNMNYEFITSGTIEEIDFTDDTLKDVFFKINDDFYTGLQVVQWAQNAHDDIHAAEQEEADEEAKYERELSSPYMAGRI